MRLAPILKGHIMKANAQDTSAPAVEDIAARIGDALSQSAQQQAKNITVSIEDSHVTLRGTVSSWTDRETAQAAAWAIPGIGRIVNELKVNCG
jgi:osmotically-inducible protein OsmY